MSATPARVFSIRWIWLFPIVYAIHLLDEWFYWIGTAVFATEYLGIYFTNYAWLWVNVPSLLLMVLAAWLVVFGVWPEWVVVALAVHLLAHSLGRVPTSAWFSTIQPGLFSGVLLCLPLAIPTMVRGYRLFTKRELGLGVVVGVTSIQPLWHFALLPWLPAPSAA